MQKRIPVFIGLALLLIVGLTLPSCFEGLGSALAGDSTIIPPTSAWERAAAARPNDWRAQHAWAELAEQGEEAIRRYDRVIERFPDRAALYASRVIRYCQITEYRRAEEFQLSGDPVPAQFKRADRQLLEQGLQAAREGMKVEPDNAFFRYAAASFLFGLKRDAEAVAEVASGAKLPRHDTHIGETGANRIHAIELSGGSPIQSMTGMAMVLFPHCAKQRQVARLVGWYGKQDEQHGNPKIALERFGHVLRMGEQTMDGANTLIEGLVGAAIVHLGVSRGIRTPWRGPVDNSEERRRLARQERTAAFAAIAREHGRDDLAQGALRAMHKAEGIRNWSLLFTSASLTDPYPGFNSYFRAILRQAGLVIHAGIGFVLACLSWVYFRVTRRKEHIPWDAALGFAVMAWLPALVLLLLTSRKGRTPFGWPSGYGNFREEEMVAAITLPAILAMALWLGRVIWLRVRSGQWRSGAPAMMPRTALALVAFPLIAYAVFLFPFKQAERSARGDIRRMASEEMRIVRAAIREK